MVDVKKRRISQKDWDKVALFVRNEYEKRKQDKFRKHHEAIWTEVDRMINMEPMSRINKGDEANEWRSVVELGELAKASEIITADVMRLTFPTTKAWFEAHSEIIAPLDPFTGQKEIPQEDQEFNDKALRALMNQQHLDFGLKPRYELSVKEALHHGSYVSEILMENRQRIHEGTRVENVAAPVWKPYSMWNAYPDPSPSVIGTDMFYTGSMILVDFMPLMQLKEVAKGDGWMAGNIKMIPKQENKNKDVKTKDVMLVKYYGDIEIKRDDGSIYLPNSKVILANDKIIYYSPVDLSFPPLIYSGYERMDVRDPYYTSPLIKMVPWQKLGSQLSNKYNDAVWLRNEPPLVYDGSDASFVKSGGPLIAPGAKTPSKNGAEFKEIKIGEPEQALQGLQFIIQQLQQGLGVNAIRSGAGNDVSDKTATEVNTAEAKAEIRTAEFVEKQERTALRPFLYIQHEYNKKEMGEYSFYNPEKDAPDFMRANKKMLPDTVHFEIVGSSGVLGEQRRSQAMGEVTAFLLGNPLTAKLPKVYDIAKQLYQDGGVKNPERFLNNPQEDQGNPEAEAIKQECEAIIAEMEDKMAEMEKKLASKEESFALEEYKAQAKIELEKEKADHKAELEVMKAQLKATVEKYEIALKAGESDKSISLNLDKVQEFSSNFEKTGQVLGDALSKATQKMMGDIDASVKKLEQTMSKDRTINVTRDKQGRIKGATVH